VPFWSGLAAPSSCFGRASAGPFASADLPNAASCPNSALVQTEVCCMIHRDPTASVSIPWAYWRCRELRGDFYLESRAGFRRTRQSLCAQGPLLARPGPGSDQLPPLRNDLQSVVEPGGQRAPGLALLRQAIGALGVAMSGSGPQSFALLCGSSGGRKAPGPSWPEHSRPRGSKSWCCRCSSMGVAFDRGRA